MGESLVISRKGDRRIMKNKNLALYCAALAALCAVGNTSYADEYSRGRAQARRELEPYFRKQVVIQGTLESASGPEWSEKFFGTKLFGCPAEAAAPVEETKALSFRTAGPGPWAGGIDGINISITAPDGTEGGSLAVPSNSTARLPGEGRGPELQFFFDPTLNVRRALVDAAAAEFDRCFSRLGPGRYSPGELERLCPYRPVSRSEQKQTCVVGTDGTIGAPLPDGSGFEVKLRESTMCDFVGYGKSGDTNTSYTTCFYNEYKGVATISSEVLAATASQRRLRSVKSLMTKMCAKSKSGRRMRGVQVKACVMRQMAKVMATK
jgi:hypothetical protein